MAGWIARFYPLMSLHRRFIKDFVYQERVESLQELRHNIVAAVERVYEKFSQIHGARFVTD